MLSLALSYVSRYLGGNASQVEKSGLKREMRGGLSQQVIAESIRVAEISRDKYGDK